jgi:hypothetical protein
MKFLYPFTLTVKKGGSDKIRKLYAQTDQCRSWMANLNPKQIYVHLGKESISNPTPGLLKRFSLNKGRISNWLISNGYHLDAQLQFLVVEDQLGYTHFIFCQ